CTPTGATLRPLIPRIRLSEGVESCCAKSHRAFTLPPVSGMAIAVAGLCLGSPHPPRLPAEVDDAYAVKVNPGGLGFLAGGDLRLVGGSDAAVFGAYELFDRLGVGASLEWNDVAGDKPFRAGTLGLGLGLDSLALGGSFRRVAGVD